MSPAALCISIFSPRMTGGIYWGDSSLAETRVIDP